jgi:hypothetical protein
MVDTLALWVVDPARSARTPWNYSSSGLTADMLDAVLRRARDIAGL